MLVSNSGFTLDFFTHIFLVDNFMNKTYLEVLNIGHLGELISF